jgi:hypothetical protein
LAFLTVAAVATVYLLAAYRAQAAGLAVDASVQTHQGSPASSITSDAISTTAGGDLLVAFIASDGPNQASGQSIVSVAGGGLAWKLARRENAQAGTAEIWEAVAPVALRNVSVTATRSVPGYEGSIDVVAFSGADTVATGAAAGANGASGPPSVTLTATRAGSWVWGIGNDWDQALPRTVGGGQTLVDQYLAPANDTYWLQSQTAAGNSPGSPVSLDDSAPTGDRFDFAAVEILPAIADTTPPTAPSNVMATEVAYNQVSLSWTASSSAVGIASYDVLRDGSQVGTATGTSYTDSTVAASTAYSYTVEAVDTEALVSPPSSPALGVTTPAAPANAPVISNAAASAVTDTSATITWTTDIPSSSQVFYGLDTTYGSNTTLDTTQLTSHSQTITGLAPSTPYHFDVQSTSFAGMTSTSADATFTTLASTITLPDMQIEVPTNAISIGTSNGHHQLQFTHITWDAGTGPFEIDPTYNPATGVATFTQAIYRSTSPGSWTFDHSVPVAATGVWNPVTGADYNFPLTKFTLNSVNADGSVGSVVATSPKTDYCITADAYVGGVPNTPNQTYIPQSNCTNPDDPLGWSVGWGDEYDQTDNGQPIDLTGIADGTYYLVGTVDPNHVITESNTANNTVDTLLQISGSKVTVLSQTNPGTSPPTVSMTAPANGANVSGTVLLQASASATAPATVTSVQFLLDGQPLGSPVTTSPYSYNWTVGSTSLGNHTLSARVTDSNGDVATATPVTVDVVSGGPPPPPNNPTVSVTSPVNNATVAATVPVAATVTSNLPIASVQFYLDGTALGAPVTSTPYAINWDTTTTTNGTHTLTATATDTSNDVGTSNPITVTVQNPPPPMTCFVMQAQATAHGTTTVTTPSFHTAAAGETLIAFVSADAANGYARQHATVSGAALTWTLVQRANAQSGDAEIWQATAPSVLSAATVTSTESAPGFGQDLTVIAMEGVKGLGASVAGSGRRGAPSVTLTTTGAPSLVFAVGDESGSAIAPTLPAGWVPLEQWADTGASNTFWSQYTNTPTTTAGTTVTASDVAPTSGRWNMAAVEVIGDGS